MGGSNDGTFGTNTFTKPAWVTLIQDGVTLADYKTIHGAEVGFIEALVDAGLTDPITIIKRTVSGTQLSQWVSTHAATVLSDATTAGVIPNAICMLIMNQDGITTTSGDAVEGKVLQMDGLLVPAWTTSNGPPAYIWAGPSTQDTGTYPGWTNAITACQKACSGVPGHRLYIEGAGDLAKQTASVHYTSASYIELGRMFAAPLISSGKL